jgi:hypothetical protein
MERVIWVKYEPFDTDDTIGVVTLLEYFLPINVSVDRDVPVVTISVQSKIITVQTGDEFGLI